MELPHDVRDVSLFAVLLEALVDDVDGIPVFSVVVNALDIDAGLELLEDLPAHDLEALAGLVISRWLLPCRPRWLHCARSRSSG